MSKQEMGPSENQFETDSPEGFSQKEIYLKNYEYAKENATEDQKEIAEIQGAKLETALLTLMNRNENNREIVNNLNELLDGLLYQASFGDSSKPLSESRRKDLADWLKEKAKEARWDVGGAGMPADIERTWPRK